MHTPNLHSPWYHRLPSNQLDILTQAAITLRNATCINAIEYRPAPTPKPQPAKPTIQPPAVVSAKPTTQAAPSVFETLGNDFGSTPSAPPTLASGSSGNANWNPYQATSRTSFQATTADSADEAIRRQHLSHEAGIRSFGILFGIGGRPLSYPWLLHFGFRSRDARFASARCSSCSDNHADLTDHLCTPWDRSRFVAIGLRKLNNVGRIGGTVFGAIGLLGIPIGTLISAYLLYLLWSAKANMVFSPEYQRIRVATPHIKYKTSIVTWIVLGLLILFLIFLFAMILLN